MNTRLLQAAIAYTLAECRITEEEYTGQTTQADPASLAIQCLKRITHWESAYGDFGEPDYEHAFLDMVHTLETNPDEDCGVEVDRINRLYDLGGIADLFDPVLADFLERTYAKWSVKKGTVTP